MAERGGRPPRPAPPDAPLVECRRAGLAFRVYPDRIEVRQGPWLRRPTVLPLQAVSLGEHAGGGRLRVTTTDGVRHVWPLGRRAEEARLAVLRLLPPAPRRQ